MLNCRQFAELPTEAQVAEWFGDHLFTGEAGALLGRVGGLDIEEREKRIMVQLGSDQDVEVLLTRMGEEGVPWPSFLDPVTNQPIRIRGYSADLSALRVTLLDVPRDVEDQTVREVMSQYGKVEEVRRHHLTKTGMEHILVNRVSVRMTKSREVELPTTIFGLGSSTNGEERSIWRVSYPGAPRRCYRCGHANHLARECRRPALTMSQVERLPALGEASQEEEQVANSFPRSFAAVVKSAKFMEREEELSREQEKQKHEKVAKKIQEERRKAEEKADREAAKEAADARKKFEAEQKRASNLARLSEVSKEATQYKEKVRLLAEKAKMEQEESRSYEKELENIASLSEAEVRSGEEGGRKRSHPVSPSVPAPQAKKPSTSCQNGSV